MNFSEEPLHHIALASFPGSGDEWIRDLIEQNTGIKKIRLNNCSLLGNQKYENLLGL